MADEVDLTETNGSGLMITAVLFLIISYLSVFLRTYVRAVLTHGFQGDDWLMLVAQLNYTLSCGFIIAGVNTGLGHHNKGLPQVEEIQALKWQALATATYISNMMFIKLSIGIFLLRLATQKRYRYIIWGTIAVITIMSTVLFFWNLFQCSPVEAQWDYTLPNLKCVTSDQIVNAAYALSIMTILTDWLFALLPIPMIWKVKMSAQAKLTVSVVLGLGIFASIATLIRLKFLADLNDTADILFAGTDAMVWTLVEPGVAISAASLVTIRPLLRAWKLKGFESTDRYGSSRAYAMRSGGTGTGHGGPGNAGNGSKSRQSRGSMPGFGSDDYHRNNHGDDLELGDKSFSSSTTTTITGGGSAAAAAASGPGVAYNITPPMDNPIKKPEKARPLSRISEGSRLSGNNNLRYIETSINTSPVATTNPFDTIGPLPSGGPLSSNPGPSAMTSPPPTRPPQSPLPTPPPLRGLGPPGSPSLADPRRATMQSEMYVIEGERVGHVAGVGTGAGAPPVAPTAVLGAAGEVRPMSRDDLAWVARHQHPGWEDRHAEEEDSDDAAAAGGRGGGPHVNSSTDSVDTVGWMQVQGQRVGGGHMNNPVERSGTRTRDGAYGPL